MDKSLGEPRVVLVDGNEADRAEVGAALRAAGIAVVATVADSEAALEAATAYEPNIILIDVALADAIWLATEIRSRLGDSIRVIALVAPEHPDRAADLVTVGARAYVLKHKRNEVINSIRAVAAGSGLMATEVSDSVLEEVRRLQDDERMMRGELEQLVGDLKEMSITDWLTGLRNRLYLVDRLQGEVDRALRHDRSVALMMVVIESPEAVVSIRGQNGLERALRQLSDVMTGLLRNEDVVCRTGDAEFAMLLPESDAEGAWFVAERIREAAGNLVDTADVPLSIGIASIPEHADSVDTLMQTSEKAVYAAQGEGENKTVISGERTGARPTDGRSGRLRTIDMLVRLLALRDPALAERSRRIAELAVSVGMRLHLDTAELEHLRVAALVHDLGKVGVPDAILHKPGPLDELEWHAIREHRAQGVDLVAGVVPLSVHEAMRSATERFDGSGHPLGLVGEQIPKLARILQVADAYTAMTESRPFRQSLSPEEALLELRANGGRQFDPVVVDAIINHAETFGVAASSSDDC
ncbi:MAG: diguanylate cyclase [Acidimicrobiia bacterium]|nr:diguanylate cyclase [Acidimicrobiia bacterium]